MRLEYSDALDNYCGALRPLATWDRYVVHHGWRDTFTAAGSFGGLCHQSGSGPANGLAAIAKHMKPITVIGILLIVVGGIALIYRGFTYTHQSKGLDVGAVHAAADGNEHVAIPPIFGGVAMAAGIVLLVVGAKKNS